MKIVLGSDHAGFLLKSEIRKHLEKQGFEVVDVGTDSATVPASYVNFGAEAARMVARRDADLGIVICGTGIGISLAANKIRGVRCALCTNEFMADLARRHNDANMLALGARVVAPQFAVAIADAFLNGKFEGERHAARVGELCSLEV
ncbi:MAG TPA: ribose 5-phosphate isomerase B [Clostridiaceae bacterium]|nr:ribose 5-phosphate isomerase B [Clostridiaceae bacterium]